MMIGANIRPLNKKGLNMMKESLLEKNWTLSSHILVSKTHDFDESRPIYRIVDGFHRWEAVKSLAEDSNNEIRNNWASFAIPCVVLPNMSHKLEVAFAFSNLFLNLYFRWK